MDNDKLIEKFEQYCSSEGLSKKRVKKYYYALKKISKILNKNFEKVNKDDMIKLVAKINESQELKELKSPHTKHDYKVTIKKFWKFLNKEKLVDWVKTTIKRNELPLPKITTREEMLKLIQSCRTVRDKALISVLFESGCRIGELLNMKLSNVEFDSYGAVLIVDRGKTGSRRIRICGKSVEYLKEWVETNHPTKNQDDRIFPVTYEALSKVLKNINKRAGLNKRIHFHMFRHGRATELATKLTESELDIFLGWEQGSNMPRTYVHLSGADIEKKILQISGITKGQKIQSALDKIKINDPELYNQLFKFVNKEMSEKK